MNRAHASLERTAQSGSFQADSSYDAGLVQRFNAGDEDAFVEICARFRARTYLVAFSLLHSRSDAEEIVQDTFIRAHRALGQFRGDCALSTWLHRIALNLARNRYWHNFRRKQHVSRSFDSAFSATNPATLESLVASDAPGPVRSVVATEFAELITECMNRLGPDHRQILAQRNILNCSYEEIARTLGISIGTVKSRIARARENLRVLLAAACPEFPPDAAPAAWLDRSRPPGVLALTCA